MHRNLIAAFEKRKKAAKACGEDFTEELVLYPDELEYVESENVCTHGCKQPPRGDGSRSQVKTRYTGCQAQLVLEAVFDSQAGIWQLQAKNEVCSVPLWLENIPI
jgi:hypothetical protein